MTRAPLLRLRLVFGEGLRLGPGKVELLEHIRATGSISAAGRAMGMSYRRAWGLVEEMNAMFARALVERERGGAGGGGARLTEAGRRVLSLYRRIEGEAARASRADLAELRRLLAKS
jgi:molybdate transport system regulatory protein